LVTSPVDDRIKSEIKSIEDKLDGGVGSLLNNETYGLESIDNEVTNIEGKLDGTVPSMLDNVAIVDVDSNGVTCNVNGTYIVEYGYEGIRHVNLTIRVNGLYGILNRDNVKINVGFPDSEVYDKLDTIILDGVRTYQFDTDSWQIVAEVGHASKTTVEFDWNVTTLRPQQGSIGLAAGMNTGVQESFVPGPEYPEDSETPVNP
jgi:hypothetical protein